MSGGPNAGELPSPQQSVQSENTGKSAVVHSNSVATKSPGDNSEKQTNLQSLVDDRTDHVGSPEFSTADAATGDDPKRPRACDACRGLKVRCDQDPANPDIPCRRCAKASRKCIVTQPSRKRQKREDSRVADLEKKLEALTSALLKQRHSKPVAQNAQSRPTSGYGVDPPQDSERFSQFPINGDQPEGSSSKFPDSYPTVTSTYSNKRQRTDQFTEKTPSATSVDREFNTETSHTNHSKEPAKDTGKFQSSQLIARINSLVTHRDASALFERYVNDLSPHLPGVVFPADMTVEQLSDSKPILYACILAAGSSGILSPEVSSQIASEAIGVIADSVVRSGSKSLELIQAMQVTALWYKPAEHVEQTNFYQIIHMAAVMALDLGLGKRFNPNKSKRGFGGPNAHYTPGPHKTIPQDSDSLEARRAWLTSYYLCASASMVLRRPNLIRWSAYMDESVKVLESHPDAAPTDKFFCQHIKIQRICEDIGNQFLMNDSSATVSITDPKITYALNVFETSIKTWKDNIPPICRGPELTFFEYVANLYLHEIALHFNHNIEDFQLPFSEESLKAVTNTADTLTQTQMAALESCLKSSHGILDTILSFEIHTIKNLPTLLFFGRSVYAIVILIKMHVAVTAPGSEFGKMMKAEDLRPDYYIDQLIILFGHMSNDTTKDRPKPKVLRILGILKDWFDRHKKTMDTQKTKDKNTANAHDFPRSTQPSSQVHAQVNTESEGRSSGRDDQTDWSFDTPLFDYSRRPLSYSLGHQAQVGSQVSQQHQSGATQSGNFYEQQPFTVAQPNTTTLDPTGQDLGWGSGFEQAMDIALGSVDGLQTAGLDNWFLGDNMMSFGGFNGDMPSAQWQ